MHDVDVMRSRVAKALSHKLTICKKKKVLVSQSVYFNKVLVIKILSGDQWSLQGNNSEILVWYRMTVQIEYVFLLQR